ncbi:MAG: hypothetical protein KDI82_17845, partial [Gammaproteobacteria bacterium]|nr:hypothetical protein [Gammaproteobacteria bacterium]
MSQNRQEQPALRELRASASQNKTPALRLGLRMVRGLSEAAARRIEAARGAGGFASVQELARRAQ